MTGTPIADADSKSAGVPYRQDVAGCLDHAIGEFGLTSNELAPFLESAFRETQVLQRAYDEASLPLLRICEDRADIEAADTAIAQLYRGADLLVFFGTGGSSLGGQVLAQLGGWNIPGVGKMREEGRPRTRFYDNLDGGTLAHALGKMDLARTRFVVTSKSGGTTETLAQAICAISAVKAAGLDDKIPELFLGITEPAKDGKTNGLRTLFSSFGIRMLEHHTGIGGRYSCLTNVGLIVALSRGLDALAVRAGAKSVVDQMRASRSANDLPAAVGAAVAVALAKVRGVRSSVLMPYADKLGRLSNWYAQLWAESLGKQGEGTSPIAALGPLDQHSQLQLFMDGPRDHFITLVRVASKGVGPRIDGALAETAGLGFLGGKTVGDIVSAQAQALPEALVQAGRFVRTMDVETLDEHALGALLMHFMLETVIAGRMLGIDPFDQPAVELAKVLTRERLSGS